MEVSDSERCSESVSSGFTSSKGKLFLVPKITKARFDSLSALPW